MARSRRWLLLQVALPGACLLGGCYFIDRGGTGPPEAGLDACGPSGCDAGPDACVPSEEVCNGVDDNCDGVVDEGFDEDGDGRTQCGGGMPAWADCDDSNDNVYPEIPGSYAAPEMCDGKDNDCDGTVDEEDVVALCPAAQVCVSELGCVYPDCTVRGYECDAEERCDVTMAPPTCVPGDCMTTGCSPPAVCDRVSRSCVVPQPLGSECSTDAGCLSGVCAPGMAVGLTGGPVRFCSKACCRDSDCEGDAICWTSGQPAKLCVPAGLLGRTRGSGGAEDICRSGSACSSGICILGVPSRCLANCATDADCPMDAICGLITYMKDGHRVSQLACRPSLGDGTYGTVGATCPGLDCGTGVCLGSGVLGVYCSAGCTSDADCPPITTFPSPTEAYCGVADGSTVALCAAGPPGPGTTGTMCESDADCHDSACIDGTCADTCCSDATCPEGDHCKPVLLDTHWQTRCLP